MKTDKAANIYAAIMAKVNHDLHKFMKGEWDNATFIQNWTGTAVTIVKTLGETSCGSTKTKSPRD